MTNILHPSTPLTTPQDFIDYWNEWHRSWYAAASKATYPLNGIFGWPIYKSWLDFPEPYWGNPINPKVIFLNINPGGGGVGLNVINSNLYDEYLEVQKGNYCKTIEAFCKPTNNVYQNGKSWFEKNRAAWANQIIGSSNLTISDILCVDMVPWHAPTTKQIKPYILLNKGQVSDLIINKIIIPALSFQVPISPIKGVIARGAECQHVIDLLNPNRQEFPAIKGKARWYMNRISFAGISGIIRTFVANPGPQNMNLPDPGSQFVDGGQLLTTRDICAK